ncbi:uncharacterized protein LOC144437013 [Glandiceps talaboti]
MTLVPISVLVLSLLPWTVHASLEDLHKARQVNTELSETCWLSQRRTKEECQMDCLRDSCCEVLEAYSVFRGAKIFPFYSCYAYRMPRGRIELKNCNTRCPVEIWYNSKV